jgi:pilus assembly protein CpaC
MSRPLAKALCAAAALLTVGIPAGVTHADAMYSEAAPSRSIAVPKDKSLSFRLDEPATKIVIAQPDIAEVVATTDRSFYVRGIAPGSTNLLVYGPGGRLMEVIDVRVGFDAALLQADLKSAFPGEDLHVQNLGEGLLLTGTASTLSVATRALALAQRFAPDGASSNLLVRASQEVVLEVRIMEATRSALQDVGFSGLLTSGNLTGSWGSGLIGNVPANGSFAYATHAGLNGVNLGLQALEDKGIVRTLARPNLVAVSGGKASFLAGGEFPYPVPQQAAVGSNNSLITIDFREYGVKLNFEPVVQDNGLIRMKVAPEVSELDQANAIKIGGVQVPGLITRRTETTVEIKDGDSLAIGGLFQHDYTNDVRQFPVLGSIPVLGTLFRSARWKRNETELVIIVTPHVVTAQDFDKAAKTTSIGSPEPGAFNLMFNGRETLDPPMARDLKGPVAPVQPAPVAAAPLRSAPVAAAPVRPAPVATASARPAAAAAPVHSAPVVAASVHSAPVAAAPVRSAPVATAPVRSAPVASAPIRSTPVAATPVRSAPVAPAPTGTAAPASASVAATPTPTTPLLRGAIAPMALSTGK